MDEQMKQFLKTNKSVPATEQELEALMKMSKKGIGVIFVFAIAMIYLWVKEGANTEDLGLIVGVILFISIIVLAFEMKDKIKMKSYEKIYSMYIYVESSIYVNKASHLVVSYYDMNYGMIMKTKMNIDRVDTGGHILQKGEVLKIYVGEKKSKIHYIAVKND